MRTLNDHIKELNIKNVDEYISLKHNTQTNTLDLSDLKLESLEGIEELQKYDIRIVFLSNNNLATLKGIESLSNLEHIYVTGNKLTSLTELGKLKELLYIYAGNNKIDNFKGIPDNVKLLKLHQNNFSNLKGIEKFKKLNTLNISHNKIDSLAVLKDLRELKEVICDNNNLNSLEGIEKLPINIFSFKNNPCSYKYDGMSTKDILNKIELESHLKVHDNLRGAASIMDTGLFDFKV